MHESELWLTAWFNDHLAGVANSILSAVRVTPEDPARPWQNWIVMEILVVAILMALFAFLRPRLSVDNPGKLQHIFELFYGFFKSSVEDAGVPHGEKYVPYIGTIFIFILFMNLIGVVPGFESPTMSAPVPLGCALATFCYYNIVGIQANGILKYLGHFVGPIPVMAPLMIPIEIVSHLARPLSLTLRLYANMYAGEQVTMTFLGLTYFLVPAVFMGLHLFVAVVQAFVFTILPALYIGMATADEH